MDQHDIGGGVDLEHRTNGSDEAPKRRPGRPPKVPTAPESPIGRDFSLFEAKTIVKEITTRINDIREHSAGDEYAAMRADLLQEIVDHLRRVHPEIDSK